MKTTAFKVYIIIIATYSANKHDGLSRQKLFFSELRKIDPFSPNLTDIIPLSRVCTGQWEIAKIIPFPVDLCLQLRDRSRNWPPRG